MDLTPLSHWGWTEDQIQMLRKLWEEGLSASQIAKALGRGFTRSAILGKVHRLKLPWRKPPRESAAAQKKPPRKRSIRPGAGLPSTPPMIPVPRPRPVPFTQARRLSFAELEPGHCRFPHGEVGQPDFFYCGADAIEGRSYCAVHCRAAYITRRTRS